MNVFKMLVFSYISKLLQCSSHCTIDCGLCFVEKNPCSSENHKSAGVEREREREGERERERQRERERERERARQGFMS